PLDEGDKIFSDSALLLALAVCAFSKDRDSYWFSAICEGFFQIRFTAVTSTRLLQKPFCWWR
ncbi:hypothetical protein, partial [Burkholderia gladioli]|uniref:hypothetical protein n=1 Tax=Burkholderia gladioli TaxID=28095 RepID=UPI003FF0DA4E